VDYAIVLLIDGTSVLPHVQFFRLFLYLCFVTSIHDFRISKSCYLITSAIRIGSGIRIKGTATLVEKWHKGKALIRKSWNDQNATATARRKYKLGIQRLMTGG
jgi:hypothetical protein